MVDGRDVMPKNHKKDSSSLSLSFTLYTPRNEMRNKVFCCLLNWVESRLRFFCLFDSHSLSSSGKFRWFLISLLLNAYLVLLNMKKSRRKKMSLLNWRVSHVSRVFSFFCLIFICRALAIASIVKFFHQIYENFHFDCRIILDILKDMKILETEASVSFTNSIGFLWLHLASSLEINFPKNSSCFINFWSIVLIGHNHFFSLTLLPTSQYELLNVF